jgi:hypothetical protein
VFIESKLLWVGDLGIRPKNQNIDGWGLKIAILAKAR